MGRFRVVDDQHADLHITRNWGQMLESSTCRLTYTFTFTMASGSLCLSSFTTVVCHPSIISAIPMRCECSTQCDTERQSSHGTQNTTRVFNKGNLGKGLEKGG